MTAPARARLVGDDLDRLWGWQIRVSLRPSVCVCRICAYYDHELSAVADRDAGIHPEHWSRWSPLYDNLGPLQGGGNWGGCDHPDHEANTARDRLLGRDLRELSHPAAAV